MAVIKEVVKSNDIKDVGIYVKAPKRSTLVVEAAFIEIYSKKDKLGWSLDFSTEKTCGGCGKSLGSKATDDSTGYLLTLDESSSKAAQPYFSDKNMLALAFKFKITRYAGVPDTIYIVNAKEGKPAK